MKGWKKKIWNIGTLEDWNDGRREEGKDGWRVGFRDSGIEELLRREAWDRGKE